MQHVMHPDAAPDATTNAALMHPLMQHLMHSDAATNVALMHPLMQQLMHPDAVMQHLMQQLMQH